MMPNFENSAVKEIGGTQTDLLASTFLLVFS
jgi:hypothetical protein